MSTSGSTTRIVTAVLVTITTLAALSAAVIGLTGWPPQAAFAVPIASSGVAEEQGFGPEVAVDDKFDSALTSATPDTAMDALLMPASKTAAPAAAAAAKPATKVRKAVRRVTGGWRSARVSWYGPGFYGNTMAGGGQLTPTSMVVAHRSLPFGTRIAFKYKGKSATAVVMDRGPYVGGRVFDLGPGTAKALGFSGVGTVQYKVLGR